MLGIVAALALPNLIQMPRRAKESVLRNNLQTIRKVLDQHYGDKGYYPPSLDVLVDEGYFRTVPRDPLTEDTEWGLVYDEGDGGEDDDFGFEDDPSAGGEPGILDVYSLSEETALDGSLYSEW